MVNNITYRVEQLEKNQESMRNNIEKMLTNHLPHLAVDVKEAMGQIAAVKSENRVLAIINAGAIIVGILVAKLIGTI